MRCTTWSKEGRGSSVSQSDGSGARWREASPSSPPSGPRRKPPRTSWRVGARRAVPAESPPTHPATRVTRHPDHWAGPAVLVRVRYGALLRPAPGESTTSSDPSGGGDPEAGRVDRLSH